MGILCGLAAAVCWGVGDFLITHLTRRVGTHRALITIQALSLVFWLVLMAASPNAPTGGMGLWGILLLTALAHVLGLVFVYRAFEIGTLSIVSPISAGFAVVTALLSLAAGERPPAIAVLGAALLILGVVLATRSPSDSGSQRPGLLGVPEAILSALAFGTMFWLFYFHVEPKVGHVWPLVLLKTMACGSTILILFLRRESRAGPRFTLNAQVVLLAVGAAAADTLAWLTYIWGSSSSYATVVTALASLFSVFTVLLAWRFLRERLVIQQWAGVGIILLGILLVSL